MIPAIRDEWCRRLRSGEYEQGMDHLHKGNGYCCLGVLSDMWAEATGNGWRLEDGHFKLTGVEEYEDEVLPQEVKKWAGLDETNPTVPHPDISDEMAVLSELNDNGYDFNVIAAQIEVGL